MSVDERHRRLHRRLQEVLGHEEAETLRDRRAPDAGPFDTIPRAARRELEDEARRLAAWHQDEG